MSRWFGFRFITPPENQLQMPFRVLSTLVVRAIAPTRITPNLVTATRMVIVIAALILFANGGTTSWLWAVGLFYVFEVLDHVDGDLARQTRRFSRLGPLLEQFVDTWASRPSNVLGLCVAVGMYRQTDEVTGFVLFGATALGRLLWLEYRDVFGWERNQPPVYRSLVKRDSGWGSLREVFEILYVWNNTFLLLGALLFVPADRFIGVDSLVVGFLIVAVLNNLPWIAIVIRGFRGTRT